VVLEARAITRRYGSTMALAGVDLELRPGEVHCLVGENGAGKSTLVKILTGLEQPDHGRLQVDGEPIHLPNVSSARQLGIAAVYQHPVVFSHLTVTENVFAGRQLTRRGGAIPIIDRGAMRASVERAFERLGIDLDPDAPMQSLSVGNRQLVEIAKAIVSDLRILVLDEPTASLSDAESAALFRIVTSLIADGVAVLLITHRLEEAFEVGSRITVLRDGHMVGSHLLSDVSRDQIIRMMVGRSVELERPRGERQAGEVILEIRDWSQAGVFRGVSFQLRRGEILGFGGLVGAGRSEVARSIVGIGRVESGELLLHGAKVTPRSPRQMLGHGVAYLSEDRHGSGLTLSWPAYKNVSLPVLAKISRGVGLLDSRRERSLAIRYAAELGIRPADPERLVSQLSGGNQQKVLLARWIATEPEVLILDEPTAGIDVGAKVEVHAAITRLAARGVAVVLISSELPELVAMADRVIVFSEGQVTATLTGRAITPEAVMRAATDQRGLIETGAGASHG